MTSYLGNGGRREELRSPIWWERMNAVRYDSRYSRSPSLRLLTHPLAYAFANLSCRIFNIWAMLALRGIAVLNLWSTICLHRS